MVRPVPDQSWVSKSATETTSPVALSSAVQKERHPSGSIRLRGPKATRHWAKVVAGFPRPALEGAAVHWRRLCVILLCVWVKRTGTGRQALSFWVMNRFRSKSTVSHITIAVALIGAAVTIGLAIWHSQKGKTQGPAIIDNQLVSKGQR